MTLLENNLEYEVTGSGGMQRATAAIDWEAVKRLVRAEVEQHGTIRPTDLLDVLADQYPDVIIKEGVLRLLQEQTIKMTPNQQLQLADAA